ncbi:MAG: c-type cytochrome biogenesis protein CcmI [Boseongicola sp.]|nr:MAG: c-type cytochrome biogenesis protein CcmI [Boseongicola sp.]
MGFVKMAKRHGNVVSRHALVIACRILINCLGLFDFDDYMGSMIFWLITLGLAVAIVALLVSALLAARSEKSAVSAAESDIALYKDQLNDVERDLARGVLSEDEAKTARTEVARRLLDADKRASARPALSAGQSLPALAMVTLFVLGGTFGLYAYFGAPGYGDLPMTARLDAIETARAERPSQTEAEAVARDLLPPVSEAPQDFQDQMARLRAALEERPDDVRGLTLLAQFEARLGNYTAARQAQERLVQAKGDTDTLADRQRLLDIMVFAAGGYVSPEAEAVLDVILQEVPNSGAALYYLGLSEAQAGRADLAFPIWRRLLETSGPDAPWFDAIRAEIGDLAATAGVRYDPPEVFGPSAEDIAAAQELDAETRRDMIQNMVSGLAARLADEGGPPEDWARLIRSLGVLGQDERAFAIAEEARVVFERDAGALALINAAQAAALGDR